MDVGKWSLRIHQLRLWSTNGLFRLPLVLRTREFAKILKVVVET